MQNFVKIRVIATKQSPAQMPKLHLIAAGLSNLVNMAELLRLKISSMAVLTSSSQKLKVTFGTDAERLRQISSKSDLQFLRNHNERCNRMN